MRARKRKWGSITRDRDGWRVRGGEDRQAIGTFRDEDYGGEERSRDAAEQALEIARRAHLSTQRHASTGRAAVLVTYGRKILDRWDEAGSRRGIAQDRSRFEKHIATSPFAFDPIGAIEHRQIQRWVRALASGVAEGPRGDESRTRSRRTVLNALNLLRAILRCAIEDEIIDDSPARGIVVPRGTTTEEDFLLLEEREVDLVLAAPRDDFVTLERQSAYVVALFGGLRPGELWGLRWGDASGTELVVRHSRKRATKGGRVRRVPLLEPARAILSEWQEETKSRLGRAPAAEELVWPSEDGRHYGEGHDAGWADRRITKQRKGYRAAYTQLGARWRMGIATRLPLKDLRHTCACALLRGWWVERGWIARRLDLIEIRDWLGHQSITTTERHYARLAPGGLLDVVKGQK